MSKALTIALNQRRSAELKVAAVLKQDYPLGAPIAWTRGGNNLLRRGSVVQHAYGDRIMVRNAQTGRELFIHAHDIHSDF